VIKFFESLTSCDAVLVWGTVVPSISLLSYGWGLLGISHTVGPIYLPAGPAQYHAIKLGYFALDFLQVFDTHADDKVIVIMFLGSEDKKVVILVSSQLVQLCDDLFKIYQHARYMHTYYQQKQHCDVLCLGEALKIEQYAHL